MQYFKGHRSRPATSGGTERQRHSGTRPDDHDDSTERTHKSRSSLHRLSLSFSNIGENTFGSIFTQEPESLTTRKSEEKQRPLLSEQTAKAKTAPVQSKDTYQTHPSSPPHKGESEQQQQHQHHERAPRPERFSLLKFRHASDPQLSLRYKDTVEIPTEPLPTPKIITTAPTSQLLEEPAKKSKTNVLGRSLSPFRKSAIIQEHDGEPGGQEDSTDRLESATSTPNLRKQQRIHFDPFLSKDHPSTLHDPPAYGDETSSALAIPVSRLSESGGSEGSSGDHKLYARTTTTISTTTTIFRLKRKKKDKGPLFPLPEKLPRPSSERTSMSIIDENSRRSMSPGRRSTQAVRFEHQGGESSSVLSPSPPPLTAFTNAPLGSPGPVVVRKQSALSTHSAMSTPSLVPPQLDARERSSTMGSLGKLSDRDGDITPQATMSSRTSTSTFGRKSFGDILHFSHRTRQNSAPPRNGSGNSPSTPASKSNSMQINREAEPEIIYPTREESDTPATYLEKLEAAVQRGSLATILCKNNDDFAKTCLRKYMRGFSYFGESIDMAVRKMLMEVELPKETQQIDRLLAGFADRYHECNPGIFQNADEASIVAFSILLLHSDNHNKNNKRKMQKGDYVKNTQHGRVSVSGDVLECFYDNICYTPFIHFEDEVAVNSHRLAAPRPKKGLMRSKSSENLLRNQIDPYTLILDNKLDLLRPPLKEVIDTQDTYSSTGTLKSPNSNDHHKAFSHSAALQIVSARSRPDAFATQATISNPLEAQAGLVSIKVAKVGLLWRKDIKKKKAKRPWQEWGAILTDSKLYFFRDIGWVKKLMAQYDNHVKQASKAGFLIFKPPLTSFAPDALMAMDDAVALLDSGYKKHKNAFTFIKHGGFEEVFLANTEAEMNDWIGKLNYAATFRTAGVRMRGLLGTTYEGKHLLRENSELSVLSNEASIGDHHGPPQKGVDPQMAWEIMFYRRQLINEKISSLDDRLAIAQKELDQLMRNARHLLILLPIPARTREAVVLAAGRMSAKLKWTRVEVWRAKTHRDILIKDLEAEANMTCPPPADDSHADTPKTTPQRASQQTLPRSDNDAHSLALSSSMTANNSTRRPSQIVLEQIKTSETSPEDQLSSRPSHPPIIPSSPKLSPVTPHDEPSPRPDTFTAESPALHDKSSVISSQPSRLDEEMTRAVPGDNVFEEAAASLDVKLVGTDGDVPDEPDRDRPGTIPTPSHETPTPREKEHRTSVRRSLQRSLRDGHHGYRTPSHNHHHHHHHRKGRESGSSGGAVEDGRDGSSVESQELRRGAGSFILHGKKASVITMSPEWQTMAVEERMKSRPVPTKEERDAEEDEEGMPGQKGTNGDVHATPRQVGTETVPLASPDRETFHSAHSSRKDSIATSMTESEVGPDTEHE